MDRKRMARELVSVAKALTAYSVHPSAKKRPMNDDDAADVVDAMNVVLNAAYSSLRSLKQELSKAQDGIESSRVNLNFVQIGAQAPGSVVDSGLMRRVHRAVQNLERAAESLESARKSLWDGENEMVQADKEIR